MFLQGSYELFEERIRARIGHFMPASLLKSQFDALQEPSKGETGETGLREGTLVVVDAEWPVDKAAKYASEQLLLSN